MTTIMVGGNPSTAKDNQQPFKGSRQMFPCMTLWGFRQLQFTASIFSFPPTVNA